MEWQQQAIVCRDGVDSGCRALDVARVPPRVACILVQGCIFQNHTTVSGYWV